MNAVIQRLLSDRPDNHMLPFFWQHGEDERTLRQYVSAIHQANCGAFCVESRPHPDFCGPKWWADMEVILDEARKRGMKVWILDDSHFPTGYANGALADQPDHLCRQNLFCRSLSLPEQQGLCTVDLNREGLLDPPQAEQTIYERMEPHKKYLRTFHDDRLLSVSAVSEENNEVVDLTAWVQNGILEWEKPQGAYLLQVLTLTRNSGSHRNYINMLDHDSCRLLIKAVYEPHWERYQEDFGQTIAGFFSDEPEFGNGPLYIMGNKFGMEQDLPWSTPLETMLKERLGEQWAIRLPLLFRQGLPEETAQVRWIYMDAITRLVRETFSYPLGDWCRRHGVQYIGHIIEDQGQHCRTGCSLGHYFRSLEGQDMSGIDDIGGQVLPQGEDQPEVNQLGLPRNAEFYHYGLAKLAQSAAAIEPAKQGRAMCEIFGNYGWSEGVRLEKYLADHFLVRGVNYFVPHAFSPKAFPDPDCPPHFYAHGHHPQFRHFGALMAYMNRVATLISSETQEASVAILYHGESEWMDNDAMPFEKVVRVLYDRQIDSHILPGDVLECPAFYHAKLANPFVVNRQQYQVMIVPGCDYLTKSTADGLMRLRAAGVPVLFADRCPVGICDDGIALPEELKRCPVVELEQLADAVRTLGVTVPELTPANNRVRILQIGREHPLFLLVNEGEKPYEGIVRFPGCRDTCCFYDPWENCLYRANNKTGKSAHGVTITLQPLKSMVVVFGNVPQESPELPVISGKELRLSPWSRCLCSGIDYPYFSDEESVMLPDALAEQKPEFSGYARYKTTFETDGSGKLLLCIEDAAEGVEVFVNGTGCGIQVAPPFIYDLTRWATAGKNELVIEVSTTLERACYPLLKGYQKQLTPEPSSASGLTGSVRLYQQQSE